MKGVIVGQAAADLRNSSSVAASNAAPSGRDSSADDLLSKIAGDEIDRLLGDVADPSQSETIGGTDSTDLDPSKGILKTVDVDQEIDMILGPSANGSVAPARAQENRNVMQAQLDELLTELSSDPPRAAAVAESPSLVTHDVTTEDSTLAMSASPAVAPESAASIHADVAHSAASAESLEAAHAAAERSALTESLATVDETEPVDAPLPLYLKPLEILNSPFASMPAWFTELLGKIGIITTINALAVIAYVIFFRAHRS